MEALGAKADRKDLAAANERIEAVRDSLNSGITSVREQNRTENLQQMEALFAFRSKVDALHTRVDAQASSLKEHVAELKENTAATLEVRGLLRGLVERLALPAPKKESPHD